MESETLDRIARSGEAVFATDSADRIILWNKKCEDLLGRSPRSVVDRRCYEVLAGRDVHGNMYCHRSCPVAFQARVNPVQPVNRFSLSVDVEGKERSLRYSMFLIPSYHPALSVLVHVLREADLENRVDPQIPEPAAFEPLWPLKSASGETIVLTRRQKEILLCLAHGMAPPSVAKKLSITQATLRNHIAGILQKLDVHSMLAAVVFAYQHNLLGPVQSPDESEDFANKPPRRENDS